MTNKKISKMSTGKKMAIGAGIVAVGAATGGAYYILGPNAKAHQKKVAALLNKIKKEVEKEAKKAKEISVPLYHKAVDTVSKTYAKHYKAHEKDIKAFTKKLKNEWKGMKKMGKS
ncbi:MAG: hypothetical protein NUV53_00325 [Patescibacteria group bacterium]|nr:hypothetical protein [Patescibacteria group bacterium]